MPNTSIVFDPELDERQLGRETDKVNEELQEVGQGVPVSFEGDMSGVQDGLEMPGGGGGAAAGGGGGGGAAAEGAAAMAGKIPKPVAGVAAAAALPVALAGGVGLGLLGAMSDASAKLGTSASILGVAKDNFFRAPGDLLDESIVRPLSKDLLDISTTFDELFRGGKIGQAFEFLTTGNVPGSAGLKERAGGILGTLGGIAAGGFAGAKAGGAAGAALGSFVPGVGTAAVGTGGAITGAIVGAIGAAPIGGRVGAALANAIPDFNWPSLPDFSWPNLPDFSWPNLPDFPEWPDLSLPNNFWPDVSLPNNFWPDIGDPFGGRNTGGGGGIFDEIRSRLGSGDYRGGVVNTSGIAQVHSGEMIGDERQLIEELSNAINGGSGGGGGSMDTTALENKLDRLHRDLKQLQSAFDVTLETNDETLARASNNGRRNRLSDTDPTV